MLLGLGVGPGDGAIVLSLTFLALPMLFVTLEQKFTLQMSAKRARHREPLLRPSQIKL